MLKDQKYQQVADKSARGFKTFEEANASRTAVAEGFKKAKDRESKVKVRLRANGLFDVVVYKPIAKTAETKA
jgi:hypothetical protein